MNNGFEPEKGATVNKPIRQFVARHRVPGDKRTGVLPELTEGSRIPVEFDGCLPPQSIVAQNRILETGAAANKYEIATETVLAGASEKRAERRYPQLPVNCRLIPR